MTLFGAYYYGWHKGPWLARTARPDDLPLLGEYDNTRHGPAVTAHMEMAAKAGLDFLAVSWWGNDYGYILDAAKQAGIKITYLYESMRFATRRNSIEEGSLPRILEDMPFLKDDMQEECWLRINGNPVLMIYVTRAYKSPKMIEGIRKELGDVFLVGDELFWNAPKPEKLKLFDAVTAYNMYQPGRFSTVSPEETCRTYLDNCREFMKKHSAACSAAGIPLWGNAKPGYDDTGVRPQAKHPPIPSLGGRYFETALRDALECSAGRQCLMITSFNEHYESTGVEPRKSYGNLYLDVLKKFKAEL